MTATVLVVEDNPAAMKVVRTALAAEGFTVVEATDGGGALALARERRPALVLLDLILPDRDGFSLLPELRAARPDAAIVAMSGFFSRAEEARTSDAGFDDVLVKPLEPTRLCAVVRSWLGPGRPRGRVAPSRVLLVDDDPTQLKLVSIKLRALGFEVEVAGDGVEGLERLRAAPFDVVVSDVLMPRMDGFALCRAVRTDPALAGVRVVLATSKFVEDADRRLAEQVGADAYVVRTSDLEQLVQALLAALAAPTRHAPARPPDAEVEREYTARVVRQLERQAALNASILQRCTLQGAALSILGGIADALADERDVHAGLREVLWQCLDAGGISHGAIYLVDPAAAGRITHHVHVGAGVLDASDVDRLLRPGEPLHPVLGRLEAVDLPGAGLAVPISHGGERLGVLLLGGDGASFDRGNWLAFARALGGQIGQAVALARAFERVTAAAQQQREAEAALRRSQDQLRQAQKMEAIGRLAGGVAHDFNNLLTGIIGFSELAAQRLAPGAPAQRELEEVRKAADRAARLTHQLLTFSRHRVASAEVVDVNEALADLERLLARVIGEDIDLRVTLAPDAGRVRLDRTQLEQVVMNLVVNARDAMPAGGQLSLETAVVPRAAGADERPRVVLRVRDTGCGMSPETREHLFEPFFTTKPPGQGTGLGLSTAWGIVLNAGGALEVETAPGAGTTFTILLPREDEPAALRQPEPRPDGSRPRRRAETILLVEDDAAVRDVIRAALELEGYRLLVAPGGEQALSTFRAAGDEVALVITDVVMAGMSGPDLVAHMRAERPGLPVLFMSGYADGRLRATEEVVAAELLHKPFTPGQLLRRIQALLDPERA